MNGITREERYQQLAQRFQTALRRRQRRRALKTLRQQDLPEAGSVRQRIEENGEDPVRAAAGYLVALASAALDTPIDDLEAGAAGRVLLAEELLLILTGSADLEAVREWIRAQ